MSQEYSWLIDLYGTNRPTVPYKVDFTGYLDILSEVPDFQSLGKGNWHKMSWGSNTFSHLDSPYVWFHNSHSSLDLGFTYNELS